MGDTSVDFFLETLKELITSSKLDSIIKEKHQLQALEEEIKYLRGFLKVAEKKRNEHSEVMKLVMEIRDVVSEAENIVDQFVIHAFEHDHLSLDLESVKKEIKTLTAKLEHINDGSVPPINSSSAPNSRLSIDCCSEIEIERGTGDPSVDFCLETLKILETLKELITSSKLDSIRRDNHLLQFLEKEIKCLRVFVTNPMLLALEWETRSKAKKILIRFVKNLTGLLKVKKRKINRFREWQTRHASEAKNILERFVIEIDAFEADHLSFKKKKKADHLSLDLESVKKEIKTSTAKVKQIYDENIYDIYGTAVKKHSFARSGDSSGESNTSKVVKEKVVVGFEDEVKTLLEKLHDKGESRLREIITIIGAAGGGKTTLAREVFHHPLTSYTFEIHAWVDVSQNYDKTTKKDLLIRVLKSAFPENHEDYENSSEDMLGEKLLRCLKGRKYLIVMDDVWGIEAWNDIQRSFPNECNGSKVLFTSRQLVQLDGDFIPHYLVPLTKRHSWELLQKKVFGMKYCCPPELVDIGVKIAEKCEGLPLAIVAIAGILSTEDKTLDVWGEVAKNLSSIIAKNKEAGCMEILELSYNHLPLHLKACFLYIGAFLEDSEIRVRELLWLWIAEGFIKQSEEGKSLEAVARDHLINLIDRSLVMVARKSSLGGINACRIHDLLRLFCLKKAEEDNFFVQIHRDEPDDSFSPSATNTARRLFIAHRFFNMSDDSDHPRNFHSFLCLPSPISWDSSFKRMRMSFFARNFGRLRVFSVISAEFEVDIQRGCLVHLRYLATRTYSEYDSRELSKWISNLLNLETLDLKAEKLSDTFQLPCDIFKMCKLRHLYSKNGVFMYHFGSEEAARVGFDHSSKLDSLQTLHQICACKDCQNFLVRTPNLRKLGLAKNIDLRDDETLDLEFLKCLETLNLSLFIPMARMKLPLTVKRLTLRSTSLKWEELSIFQNLPSLEVLKLGYGACIGPVWNASGEGFPQLKYLRLSHMYEIEEWIADEDQFPRLEDLVLEDCSKLEQIPIDFANLNELREIKVTGCTRSLEESAKKIRDEQKYRKGDDDCPNLIVKHNFWDSSDESE